MMDRIKWNKVRDRHIEGVSSVGKVYIRLNREGQVTGGYLISGDQEKWVPMHEDEASIEWSKMAMEEIVQKKILHTGGTL